jgi:hypothetical protein
MNLDALVPWHHGRQSANTTRFLAPWVNPVAGDQARWVGRAPGDQARWTNKSPSIQGHRQGKAGLGGLIPRRQGHSVTSGPIWHEDPDILMQKAPWDQAADDVKRLEGAWNIGAACPSNMMEPRSSRFLDPLFPGEPSRSIGHQRLGSWLSLAPWRLRCQGGDGIEVPS